MLYLPYDHRALVRCIYLLVVLIIFAASDLVVLTEVEALFFYSLPHLVEAEVSLPAFGAIEGQDLFYDPRPDSEEHRKVQEADSRVHLVRFTVITLVKPEAVTLGSPLVTIVCATSKV